VEAAVQQFRNDAAAFPHISVKITIKHEPYGSLININCMKSGWFFNTVTKLKDQQDLQKFRLLRSGLLCALRSLP
jgi:hypothetical protein